MDEGQKPVLFRPAVGNRGMTELHVAACYGDRSALTLSLDAGADVNAVDSYRGFTPLHWLTDMAAAGGPRIEMLKDLSRHGADLNVKAANGETPLSLARAAGSDTGDKLAAELLALGADDFSVR